MLLDGGTRRIGLADLCDVARRIVGIIRALNVAASRIGVDQVRQMARFGLACPSTRAKTLP